ncbi:D-glycero-beta-D-manno-heptose 1,7-bisphosphate 7-phosphatase [Piscinibacter sp. XHJ-5]|uniref:D-glycero-beta-D-manno-heptose 1,7-bisphosphate 7-phosphatase n=1 Tax=Piscinibacter sp. XHJ-5 TaxID=3037797 RepID=UPI002452CFE4|nr:D-glycero-beta-D-manno-heptose 1,7-bisphosphate 7-phosphatase [Piscinibacter sp. XHJ-5]
MKLIILDRDGTINEDRDDFVKSPEEWVPLPGALEAIARLNHAGWHTVLATNQSGLGRGLFDMAMLNAMHVRMNQMLAKHGGRIDAVFFCPHAPEDQCDCRKPLPGLMLLIGERYGLDLGEVHVVGDTLRDVQAGRAAGCPTHLVRTGKCGLLDEAELEVMLQQVPGTKVHADLGAFADAIIQEERLLRGLKGESDSGRFS